MPQVGAFVFSNAKKVYIILGTAVTYYLGLIAHASLVQKNM